jgi:hypothetical protein
MHRYNGCDCFYEAFRLDFVGVKHFYCKWNNFSISYVHRPLFEVECPFELIEQHVEDLQQRIEQQLNDD